MIKNITEKLDSVGRALERQNEIVEKLDNINQTLKEISAAVAKPKENSLVKLLEFLVLIGGVTTFLTAADIIRSWILGG